MKKWFIGILAFILTIVAAYYQRTTGPTYPKSVQLKISENIINFEFPHSHDTSGDCPIIIPLNNNSFSAKLFYRFYPTNMPFRIIPFIRKGDSLIAKLPVQPPAGKLLYYITISNNDKEIYSNESDPQIVRFKGSISPYILIPHILLMFSVMFLSVWVLLRILTGMSFKPYLYATVIFLFLGGMVFGPIVQKLAFGEFWTGIPFGWDLTDNKTLIAFTFWLIALFTNIKKERK